MKIICMIPVMNEDDIIEEVINHYLNQEIGLVILDNGSSDDTFKICKKYEGNGVIKLFQFKTKTFRASLIKEMLYHLTIEQSPEWIILSDADEFLESPNKGETLKKAIMEVEKQGSNVIQFDKFEFFMTDDDNKESTSITDKMPYYSCVGDFVYRAWKYFPGIRIGDTAGHYPLFPEGHRYKIYDKKFVLRHYPFRNENQAKKKINARTRGQNNLDGKNVLVSAHNKKIAKMDFSKKIPHTILSKYTKDGMWDLKIKHIPYETINPPKRNEIFTEDGFLKEPLPTAYEMKLMLNEKLNKNLTTRAIRKFKKTISNK